MFSDQSREPSKVQHRKLKNENWRAPTATNVPPINWTISNRWWFGVCASSFLSFALYFSNIGRKENFHQNGEISDLSFQIGLNGSSFLTCIDGKEQRVGLFLSVASSIENSDLSVGRWMLCSLQKRRCEKKGKKINRKLKWIEEHRKGTCSEKRKKNERAHVRTRIEDNLECVASGRLSRQTPPTWRQQKKNSGTTHKQPTDLHFARINSHPS